MPQVRILSSGPHKESCPMWAVLFVLFCATVFVCGGLRAKQGTCFGGTRGAPPVAGGATRVSGRGLCATQPFWRQGAHRAPQQGCRRFESCHPDQASGHNGFRYDHSFFIVITTTIDSISIANTASFRYRVPS